MSDHGTVWAIFQARFSSPSEATGGFCATAWLIEASAERLVFATAAHAVSEEVFVPKAKNLATKVWLSDGKKSIPITVANRVIAENDVAFLIVAASNFPAADTPRPIGLNWRDNPVGKQIYNLGFPERAGAGAGLGLSESGATFNKGPWIQTGRALKKVSVTVSSDVKMTGGDAFLMDYTSEVGFSGGPVFIVGSDLAVGMMSLVVPAGDAAPTRAIAVTATEILKQKNKFIK